MFIESYAEHNYALLLERDTSVVRYQSQPLSINHQKNKRYTPDFIEDRGDCIAFSEVKSSCKQLNKKDFNKYSVLKGWFEERHADFSVHFIDHNDPAVKMQRKLYRYHSHDTSDLFEQFPYYTGTIGHLIKGSKYYSTTLCKVYSGIFRGEIDIKDHHLSMDSMIEWGIK
jgi:hypothetical protein